MRISEELIRRCSSRNLLPPGTCDGHPLRRITHLYLQEQHIRRIENLECCTNLLALYLYDNKIQRIENLEALKRLNCLYLQNNRIEKIENLEELSQLAVINLGHNCIQRLENLESLGCLRELFLEYQKLPGDPALQIDVDSINEVAESLKVINLSGNGLPSLSPLRALTNLETLLAEDNELADLDDLVEVASCWRAVRVVRLNGNPVCRMRKYRDNMVVACLELEELDGRVVSQSYRNFLLNWRQCQILQSRKKESYSLLKPFLEEQIHNKQLSPPRPTPASSRPGSSTQSESSSTSKDRSRQRKDRSTSRTRALQEMPMRLVRKLKRGGGASK